MLASDVLDRCSALEFQEWRVYLSLTPEDLSPPPAIEDQFMTAFGVKRG